MSLLTHHHGSSSSMNLDSAFAHMGWASLAGFGSIFSAVIARMVGFGVVDVSTLKLAIGAAASIGSFCFGLASLAQAGLAVKRYLDDRTDKRRQRFERLYRISSTTADPKITPPGQD